MTICGLLFLFNPSAQVTNAIKFSNEFSEIIVEASVEQISKDSGLLKVFVVDFGAGFESSTSSRL